MAQHFEVHPQNPQPRLLKQAAAILQAGGIAAIPTDSSYALVCRLDDKAASENMRRLRQVDDKHHLTLLCKDLSELASYARVDNRQYRLLKLGTPGPYTFILEATLLSTTLIAPGETEPMNDAGEIRARFQKTLQAVVDAGACPMAPTTVIDFSGEEPVLVRQGRGSLARLGL